jgi:hypothetical protein
MLDLVEVVLRADGLQFARLDGSVPQQVKLRSPVIFPPFGQRHTTYRHSPTQLLGVSAGTEDQ